MDLVSLAIWFVTLALGLIAFSRPGRLHLQGLRIAWRYFYVLVPRLIAAVLVSGFFLPSFQQNLWLAASGRSPG